MSTHLSAVLDSMIDDAGAWRVEVPESWRQGRSVYGGLQAALAVRAMRAALPAAAPLRVLQVSFVAPVPAGPISVRAELIRTGKTATHVEARLFVAQTVAALAVGVFGNSRTSRVRVAPERRSYPESEPFDIRYEKGLVPEFMQHMNVRWLHGAMPFSGAPLQRSVLRVGLPEQGLATEEHVVALADTPPPVALSFMDTYVGASSLTWTLEMLTDSVSALPLQGYVLDAELVAGGHGYTSQSVTVWGPGGEPLALSRQSMVVFG
jgi:acyl-coenzyme A thioesterase PaaI-like protein